jgi:hippurate hydrolase
MTDLTKLVPEAEALLADAVAMRRDIHAKPELGTDLPITQARVLAELDGLGIELSSGSRLSSVVGVLDSGKEGPTVLLRADMDALPMPEDTDVDFKSTFDGVMHACGHDAHVAMLSQSAKILAGRRDELTGRVVFMFQPGEEGHGGAQFMIDEGVLSVGGPVDTAFAIHITPSIPSGVVAARGGTMMASVDNFKIDVVGRGGHASQPHLALDPIPIACEIVLAIQSMVTRKVNAFDPAVVTVAHVRSGTTTNVIPESAMIEGTIRTVSALTRAMVPGEVEKLARGIAGAHGATVEFALDSSYPVTVNDANVAAWSLKVAHEVFGEGRTLELPSPVMGAEDFSYVLEQVPGAMVFVGACPEGVDFWHAAPNHSNKMVLNESAMTTGIALYSAVALAKGRA